MAQPIDIGRVGIWTGVLDAVPSAEAQRVAARLEEYGFPVLWIPETVGRDPFVTAALLLSATSTLKVATGIANIYARDAVTMANTQRTLEEAFPGRFLLGLGVSHHHLVDRVRHHDYTRPYSAMVRYLAGMDAAIFRAVGPTERLPTVLAASALGCFGWPERGPTAPTRTSCRWNTRRGRGRSSAPGRCSPPNRWWCSSPTAPGRSRSPARGWPSTSGRPTT